MSQHLSQIRVENRRWVLQFVGHYYEGKPPEFFHDWRFLLVGLRWWLAKIKGRA